MFVHLYVDFGAPLRCLDYKFIHIYIYNIHTYIYIYICMYVCIYMCVCVYIYIALEYSVEYFVSM